MCALFTHHPPQQQRLHRGLLGDIKQGFPLKETQLLDFMLTFWLWHSGKHQVKQRCGIYTGAVSKCCENPTGGIKDDWPVTCGGAKGGAGGKIMESLRCKGFILWRAGSTWSASRSRKTTAGQKRVILNRKIHFGQAEETKSWTLFILYGLSTDGSAGLILAEDAR